MLFTKNKLQSAAGRLLVAVSLTTGLLGLMSGPAAHAASNASDASCSLSAATTTANNDADYSKCTASQRSQLASLERYTAMANDYLSMPRHSTWVGGTLTAPELETDRLANTPIEMGGWRNYVSVPSLSTDTAGNTPIEMGGWRAYSSALGRSADALRYGALGARYVADHGSTPTAAYANAARWEKLAASYHSVAQGYNPVAAHAAEAARWTALADVFGL